MRPIREWSLGQKMITVSAVCFLLCMPLCGYGLTIDSSGTLAQQVSFKAGVVLLLAAGASLVIGLIGLIFVRRQ